MPITRKFIGWERPVLQSAVDYLTARFARSQAGLLQLDRVLLVVPGRRAGRRLLEMILERAAGESLALAPPEIVTAGLLPELLYQPKLPFASEMVQRLAWAEALRQAASRPSGAGDLAHVFPQPPASDQPAANDSAPWLEFGAMLLRLHRELAAEGLDFSDVARLGRKVDRFREGRRWRILYNIQQAYLAILDELRLWDRQTARLFAIEHRECRTEREIILLATADMNGALRQMLDQVADQVTALVAAPMAWADRFDPHGCLLTNTWDEVRLELSEHEIRLAEDATGQAEAALRQIASYQGKYRADEITIGVADSQLVPTIQRAFGEHALPVRWLVGRQLPETAPYRLMDAVGRYLDRGRFGEWAALVRHPDLNRYLHSQGVGEGLLVEMDQYQQDHLPGRVGTTWLGPAGRTPDLRRAARSIEALLSDLPPHETRNLDAWTEPLLTLFRTTYAGQTIVGDQPEGRMRIAACGKMADCLNAQRQIPERLQPPVTAAQAIDLVLEQLAGEVIPAPPEAGAIEMTGWLELPLDDAPALVVTSCNEGFIPASTNGDLFLPDRLRGELGLDDNRRRAARDKYALQVIRQSREELLLVVARRDTEENPRSPSRLLFAADRPTIARRVLSLFGSKGLFESKDDSPQLPLAGGPFDSNRDASDFDIPRPVKLDTPIESMRVTAFRSYLACPYRFYLEHPLGLQGLDDRAEEMDPLAFGSLMHEVLRKFGESDIRDETDAETIRKFLDGMLKQIADRCYGSHRLAAVRVQHRLLLARFAAFARWQARWASQGWRIAHTEVPRDESSASIKVDGRPMRLRGRIDRIDTREGKDGPEWTIFDYKSSSEAKSPEQAHQKGGQWVDLQLPLYRYIAASLGEEPLALSGNVRVGYICLPKDTSKVGEKIAEWSAADFDAADEVAREVVRKVRAQEFWPPAANAGPFDTYASICMTSVFERPRPAGLVDELGREPAPGGVP